jgi:hypothetical protein
MEGAQRRERKMVEGLHQMHVARQGRPRDLLVMSHEGLSDQVSA